MQSSDIEGLPDPLVAENGEAITSESAWMSTRRPELLELFRAHVYGKAPGSELESVTFETKSTTNALNGSARCRHVVVHIKGSGCEASFDLYLYLPGKQSEAVPAFLTIGHRNIGDITELDGNWDFWPVSKILERGYATAIINVNQIAPHRNDTVDLGVHGIFDTTRTRESWGELAVWAWGCSRCMDYFETDPDIDETRAAVVGHSRGGKAALWCGAQDQRFAMVVSNESGCSGAAITRGKEGEQISNITDVFPYWFCENYKLYADNTAALPVDQHELIALMAPRAVYVSSATEDAWSDPRSEFLACVYAEPVYKLFGLDGVGITQMPSPETPLHQGSIGYHLRTGEHDLTAYDWQYFLDFADKPGVLK